MAKTPASEVYQAVGERVLISTDDENRLGIFQESILSTGRRRTSLVDFIQPLYDVPDDTLIAEFSERFLGQHWTNPAIEDLAKGQVPQERVNPDNPILSLYLGVDPSKFEPMGKYVRIYGTPEHPAHRFSGQLHYKQGAFVNDGNREAYNRYVEPLQRAGFRIERV